MRRWAATVLPRLLALAAAAVLAVGCSAQPVSEAVEQGGRGGQPAATSSAPAAASPELGSPQAPSAAPTEATATPGAASAPAAPKAPDKPSKVTFKVVSREPITGGGQVVTARITWSAPKGVATKFTVVAVTRCLREAKKYDGAPCVVKGMPIAKDVQQAVATVPGSERSVDITWEEGEIGPGPYAAVLIRASNAAGDSIFTIAWSDTVCWKCTY